MTHSRNGRGEEMAFSDSEMSPIKGVAPVPCLLNLRKEGWEEDYPPCDEAPGLEGGRGRRARSSVRESVSPDPTDCLPSVQDN